MAIFIDSGNVEEIKKYHRMGILEGVTTNPTILLKDGIKGGEVGIKACMVEIAKIIHPYPLSIEVMSNEKSEMISQAREFSELVNNVVVKIPFHGPNGEMENLEVIHLLEDKYDVPVNVTAMMSAQQCLLAATAGASYVSLFGGRVNNMGYNCVEEIKKTRKLIDDFKLDSKIIGASVREALNVVEWLIAGAHIVTVPPQILEKMIVHPYTKETVQMFLRDAASIL